MTTKEPMMKMYRTRIGRTALIAAASLLAGPACTESVGDGQDGPGEPGRTGLELAVEVPASGRAYVRLDGPELVEGGEASAAWDLALSGYDVFTNSGPSGPGDGGAIGPFDPEVFDAGEAPAVPFVSADELGGAFVGWYAYDGATHSLLSRYHVYAVEHAGRRWKVQILGYYGEEQGAPVGALYRIRYAEVLEGGAGATVELAGIDARAGGPDAPPDAPSACLDFATGAQPMLTPEQALASADWHLCFRRDAVSVNGELGGPGGVGAADLHAGESADETLEVLKARTPESELARFDALGHADLTDPALELRGDRVVSAFSGLWTDRSAGTSAPAPGTWVVQAADGIAWYLVRFDRFEGASEDSPGRVVMRVKRDGGAQ